MTAVAREANSFVSNALVVVMVLAVFVTWSLAAWRRHREDDIDRLARRDRQMSGPVIGTEAWCSPAPRLRPGARSRGSRLLGDAGTRTRR